MRHPFPDPDIPTVRGIPAVGLPDANGHAHSRDDTTRYLCAAAHLDDNYADEAIREFLVENTRPVPPSPGVDAAAVLGEALAARTRRKLRDAGLLILMIAYLLVAQPGMLVTWIMLAVVVAGATLLRSWKDRFSAKRTGAALAGAAGLLLLVSVVTQGDFGELAEGLLGAGGAALLVEDETASVLLALFIGGLMLTVLLADRMVVWRHLNERFWRNPSRPTVPPIPNRSVYDYSPERFRANLRLYAEARPTIAGGSSGNGENGLAGAAPVVVHRGFKPFVGAGSPYEPWSIAVPLVPLPHVAEPRRLTTEALYATISAELEALRRTTALAPGRRLATMDIGEQIIVSADELIDHLAEPPAVDFLRGPQDRPYTMLRRERVQVIRTDPLEWARYYQTYQIETWDRDFVVTVYVHVAVDDGALYVEWTPCVLLPIKKEYQELDQMSRSPWLPFGQALLDVIKLPATVPGRLVRLLTRIRPLPQDRGVISSDMYGSARSLREIAADDGVHNYFQLADVERYQKMLESRLVLAVSRLMKEAGYSPASFDQQAQTVISNNVQIGSVSGNVVAGANIHTGAMNAGSKG